MINITFMSAQFSDKPFEPTRGFGTSARMEEEMLPTSPSIVLDDENEMAGISTQSTGYNPPVFERASSDETIELPVADFNFPDLEDILNVHFPNVESHHASSSRHKAGQDRGETCETSERHLQIATLPPKKARKTIGTRNAEASAEVAFEFEQSMRLGLERFLGVLETNFDEDDSELEHVLTNGKRRSRESKRESQGRNLANSQAF